MKRDTAKEVLNKSVCKAATCLDLRNCIGPSLAIRSYIALKKITCRVAVGRNRSRLPLFKDPGEESHAMGVLLEIRRYLRDLPKLQKYHKNSFKALPNGYSKPPRCDLGCKVLRKLKFLSYKRGHFNASCGAVPHYCQQIS